MRPETVIQHLLEADPDWDAVDKRLCALDDQMTQRHNMLGRLGTSLQQAFPHRPDLHQRAVDLQGRSAQTRELLSRTKYAATYRRALAKVGLRPTDVVDRFTGQSRLVRMRDRAQSSGHALTYVQTKDGRRVKLDPPVEIPRYALREAWESGRQSKRVPMPPSRSMLSLKYVPLAKPPVPSGAVAHFMKRARESVQPSEWKDFTENLAEISHKDMTVMVPITCWWMAFPYGHRIAGEGQEVKTVVGKEKAAPATVEVLNPRLADIHRTYWRGDKSEFYK